MKYILITLFTVMPQLVLAGGYFNRSIDSFDSITGLYYVSVKQPGKKGIISGKDSYIKNIFIYDPKTKTGSNLFDSVIEGKIVEFIYENAVADNGIGYSALSSSHIRNNLFTHKREAKDKLLIGVEPLGSNKVVFYTATKRGENIEKLFVLNNNQRWHLDVINSVIRVMEQADDTYKVEEYPW